MALLIFAVLVLFFGISVVAMSAMPVMCHRDGQRTAYTTTLATKYQTDPVAGIAGRTAHPSSTILKPMVAILASSILLIAANAGVLGASRLSFSMGTYRQVPEMFNRVHKRFKTPIVAIIFFAAVAVRVGLPGDINQLTASISLAQRSALPWRMRR